MYKGTVIFSAYGSSLFLLLKKKKKNPNSAEKHHRETGRPRLTLFYRDECY